MGVFQEDNVQLTEDNVPPINSNDNEKKKQINSKKKYKNVTRKSHKTHTPLEKLAAVTALLHHGAKNRKVRTSNTWTRHVYGN